MNILVLEAEPVARNVHVDSKNLVVDLTDGRSLAIPIDWYPRLRCATETERRNWRLLGDGYAIEWPDLDEHIGVEGLLAGRPSGESERSLARWLQSRKAQFPAAGVASTEYPASTL